MNRNEDQDQFLGENITEVARSKQKVETSVISVRLGLDEVARLEELGRRTGRTVSQVIRDAISAYEVSGPRIDLCMWNGTQIIVGEARRLGWVGVEVDQASDVAFDEDPSSIQPAAIYFGR